MKRLIFIFILLPVYLGTQAQYIRTIQKYVPAPGQFINAMPWGWPHSAESIKDDLNGAVSLGAYGGYIVFSFEEAVVNNPLNPFGVDFTIFGNAIPGASEPGIVWVMKDENNNLLPDDTWYELAGSDYHFSESSTNYEVTYYNPMQAAAADVPWSDNRGNSGFIYANTFHGQPYYPLADSFLLGEEEQFTWKCSFVPQLIDSTNIAIIRNAQRAFGYADNHPRGTGDVHIPDNPYTAELENSGGDAFDIGWAVDTAGNYVNLDKIHFIKVQTACMGIKPQLGEVSTEISGALVNEVVSGVSGVLEMISIKQLPIPLTEKEHQLEAICLSMGRPVFYNDISWSVNMPEAFVDENDILHVSKSGELEITATLVQDTSVKAMVRTYVDLQESGRNEIMQDVNLSYPNPAKNILWLKQNNEAEAEILNIRGDCLLKQYYKKGEGIDISGLTPGLYILKLTNGHTVKVSKFMKQ